MCEGNHSALLGYSSLKATPLRSLAVVIVRHIHVQVCQCLHGDGLEILRTATVGATSDALRQLLCSLCYYHGAEYLCTGLRAV